MSDQLHELLTFVWEKEVGLPGRKSQSFAGHFADLEEFMSLTSRGDNPVKSPACGRFT